MGITLQLLHLADHWYITIRPYYFPGVAKVEADAQNHNLVVVEWCLHPDIVHKLFCYLFQPEVSLFTSAENILVLQFFSIRRVNSQALGLDAYHHPWSFWFLYAFPPPPPPTPHPTWSFRH